MSCRKVIEMKLGLEGERKEWVTSDFILTLIKLIARSQPVLLGDLLLSRGRRKISNINWKYFQNVRGNWEERRTVFNIILLFIAI